MGCLCVWLRQCEKGRRVCRGKSKCVYRSVVCDGERPIDVKWLSGLTVFVMCALEAARWLVGFSYI